MAETYGHHRPFFVTPVVHPVTGRQNHVLPCYKETTGKLLQYLFEHHQQKGIKSQTQTWWKNYCELGKQLRTVSFWLSHIRKDAVIFLSSSAYWQQARHLLTRTRFSDMLKH